MITKNMLFIVIIIVIFLSGHAYTSKSVSVETLNINRKQFNILSARVCRKFDNLVALKSFSSCIENIYDSDPNLRLRSPGFRVWCRSPKIIKFEISPSKSWQLVVLMPTPLDDTSKSDYINFSILKPKEVYGVISTIAARSYSVYATELSHDGRHPMWAELARISPWNESSLPPHKEYNISVTFTRGENVNDSVIGIYNWNTTGDNDVCFDFLNFCQSKVGFKGINVWPKSKPQVYVEMLPLNEKCTVQVTGVHGTTRLVYHTPPPLLHDKCASGNIKPEILEDVFVVATEERDTWNVRVRWRRPACPPLLYNVTVRAQGISSTVVSGNTTEVVIKGVVGEGIYNVSIYAIEDDSVSSMDGSSSHTIRRVMFPARVRRVWAWAAGAGALWAAAALAALGAVRALRRYRAASYLQEDLPDYEFKYPKSEVTEETELEVGSVQDGWEVESERVLLQEVIGEGAFGVVRRGILAPGGREVAVKMLKNYPSIEEIRSFHAEMELMKSVGAHPHVVSLVGCCSGRRPLIIAEYCSRGDLLSYLRCTWDVMISKRNVKYYNNNITDSQKEYCEFKDRKEHSNIVVNKMYDIEGVCDIDLTSLDLLSFCRQIAMGMEFLASNRLVHRDLAARNVLVTADRMLKIADFGLSRDIYEENLYKQKGNGKMPVKWMALESLTRRVYTTQSDVWSFGVVIWEIVTMGGSPYADVPAARLLRLLRSGYRMPKPVNCSSELYNIMLSCWRAKPRERPTFTELYHDIDELLNSVCADQYLTLELDGDDIPPAPKAQSYFKTIIRGKRIFTREESFERPVRTSQSNHYSSPPVVFTGTSL